MSLANDLAVAVDRIRQLRESGQKIGDYVAQTDFMLVETLAERVAEIVLNEFAVPWLRLRVSKPGALRGSQDVGIIIERGNKQA